MQEESLPFAIRCPQCNSDYKVTRGFKICNCEKCYWDMIEIEDDTYTIVNNRNAPFAKYTKILYDIRDGRYFPVRNETKEKKKRRYYKKIPSLKLDFSYIGEEEERKKRERLSKEKETLIKSNG